MDFTTSLPENTGYNGVFTYMDKFTKLTKLFPFIVEEEELSAPATGKLFFENMVYLYRVPQVVLYDKDPCFSS